jgi:hypothetical protein
MPVFIRARKCFNPSSGIIAVRTAHADAERDAAMAGVR